MKSVLTTKNALLEIGVEELPARFISPASEQLLTHTEILLKEAGLDFAACEVWSTPRRLTIFIKGLSLKAKDRTEFLAGPPPKTAKDESGNWTQAATGFAKAQGVSVDKLVLQNTPKGERWVVLKEKKGLKTEVILSELFPSVIKKLEFPKTMVWEESRFRFARPLRWIVALYGNKIIRFKLAGVTSGQNTVGLLSLGGRKLSVSNPDKYKSLLQGRCILVDPAERKKNISVQLEAAAKRIKAVPVVEPEHLNEVVNITEYPVSILGKFHEEYLSLPREVLVSVMRKHQKFFPLESSKGQLSHYFIGVRNGPSESQESVREGYERVTHARLADAKFFYDQDAQIPLEKLADRLSEVGFHEKLGSMLDKTNRVRSFAAKIVARLNLDATVLKNVDRAARLAKADLLTHMVGEFPELQGVAGRFYGLNQENVEVATALEQHYWPLTATGALPVSDTSAILAVADKIDTLAANFSVGLIPSGSADPYGLRRAAAGVVRILLERKWDLSLDWLIQEAFGILNTSNSGEKELKEFLSQRCVSLFENQGYRLDEIDAVLSVNGASVSVLAEKLSGLKTVRDMPEFGSLATAIKRVRNILKHARSNGIDLNNAMEISRPVDLKENSEKTLLSQFDLVKPRFEEALQEKNFKAALLELVPLKQPLDAFFEEVMIMTDDENLKRQRLNLLIMIERLFDSLADFSKLQTAST